MRRIILLALGVILALAGTTPFARADLVAAATRQGHRLIAVILGSTVESRFVDGASLLNYGWRLEGLG